MPTSPDAFLLAFHQSYPGVTTRAFARGTIATGADGQSTLQAGGSSYDLLAAAVPPGATVLDLGCGDGYLLALLRARGFAPERLVGVDMSPAELALARRRPALAGARLVAARAQALPLAAGAVSCVISHLGFTLMSDIEQVVAEIARVLVPGGVFLAIVGGGPRVIVPGQAGAPEFNAFELFLDALGHVQGPGAAGVPRLGDIRARSPEGLRGLFGERTGFAPASTIDIRDVTLRLDGTFDQVWDSLATSYELGFLSAAERQALRDDFRRRLDRRRRQTRQTALPSSKAEPIPCLVALSLVRCRRA